MHHSSLFCNSACWCKRVVDQFLTVNLPSPQSSAQKMNLTARVFIALIWIFFFSSIVQSIVPFHRFRRLNQLHCLYSCACPVISPTAPCRQLQHGWIFLVKANELWTWTCLLWYRESEIWEWGYWKSIREGSLPENRKHRSYSGCLSQDHSTRS